MSRAFCAFECVKIKNKAVTLDNQKRGGHSHAPIIAPNKDMQPLRKARENIRERDTFGLSP